MGSTSPPQSPQSTSSTAISNNNNIEKHPPPTLQHQNHQHNAQLQEQVGCSAGGIQLDELTAPELRRLVELRDQEIRALKFELEKYKLALNQSQFDFHNTERKLTSWRTKHSSSLNDETTHLQTASTGQQQQGDVDDDDMGDLQPFCGLDAMLAEVGEEIPVSTSRRRRTKSDHHQDHSAQDIVERQQLSTTSTTGKPILSARLSSASLGSSFPNTTPLRVAFKTGANDLDNGDEEEEGMVDDDGDDEDDEDVDVDRLLSQSHEEEFGDEDDNLEDIIQDVGEIDLNLELGSTAHTTSSLEKQLDHELVSEKQKRLSSQEKSCPTRTSGKADEDNSENLNMEARVRGNTNNVVDEDAISDGLLKSFTDAAISNLSQLAALQEQCESQQQQHSNLYQQRQTTQQNRQQQPQPSRPRQHSVPGMVMAAVSSGPTNTASTAAITATSPTTLRNLGTINQQSSATNHDPFSATAIANQAAIAINAAASIQPSSPIMIHHQSHHQPASSSSSISPTSTVQTSDLNSSHSLASVVAAAAVAAAAANADQQLHQNQQQHHHHQLNPQSRLISSAIPSPDFYHSLHHHHAQQQQQNIHQHQPSPVSSLHFSPSTSVTPSSSSLLGQSRRSISTASSSLMSPIASPNYLRRQFLPDRLPLLSPSPTSGLTTGSSSAASGSLAHILNHHQHQQRSASALGGPVTSTSSTPMGSSGSTAVSPLMSNKNSSQARLNNMQIRHKFGYLGSGRAQFNSPHGFCLGLNQEIVVADTNNHRVCIFDKSGSYITQFGSPGKEEGQLWNPRKVAILHRPTNSNSSVSQSMAATQNQLQQQLSHLQHHQHLNQQVSSPYSSHINNSSIQGGGQLLGANTGSEPLYVVCDRGAERSRMQLFTKDGAFIKKIGIHYIDIVAGLAITQNGLIIVVDSVSPTVYIINGETGILNGWFDCSGHMKEPSDIAVKSDVPGNEYFICDFKGHCVVVFSEQGEYLRKIGHDGLTSYPNGIDISDDGDILVGDSHGNRFHVVVFDRNGNFVSQFECPHVKVSRCCGLKITREGYIVTLAKNNHHVLVLDTIHI